MFPSHDQGGETGSQTGGSAKGGSVPRVQPMDMQNLLLGKQADLLNAQKEKTNAETGEIKSKVGPEVKNLKQLFNKLLAETRDITKSGDLKAIERRMMEIEETFVVDQYNKALELQSAQIRKLISGAIVDERSIGDVVMNLQADYQLKLANSKLSWAKVDLTEEQENNIRESTNRIINDIKVDWAQIDINQKEMLINNYRAELQKEIAEMNIGSREKIALINAGVKIFGDIVCEIVTGKLYHQIF